MTGNLGPEWRTFPFRGAVSLRPLKARDYTAATSERWRVIRHDGVVLCQGQRADFAFVIRRGGES